MLTHAAEKLLRQIHPMMLGSDGEPARANFTPTQSHGWRLSTLRQQVGAEEAYRRHVEESRRQSTGTYACTVGEVNDAGCRAIDDAADVDVPDHASVDFSLMGSRAARERAGRKLRDAAVSRGCQYRPPSAPLRPDDSASAAE